MALGTNDAQRSAVLGIPQRSLQKWRGGKLPTNLQRLLGHPDLLRALADDAEQQQAQLVQPEVASE